MKKGITFMTVIVAVIIMIIFVSTITISSISILNDSNKQKFGAEIAFIQEAVNNYYAKHNEYPILNSVTVNLQDVNEEDIKQFELEEKTDNNIVVYEIDFSKLGNIEKIYGNSENLQDIYAVSKNSGIVYYLKGVTVGNITYFTLTEDLKKLTNYVNTNENTVSKDGILFEPQTLEWSATSVATRVLVPNTYTDIIVSVIAQNGETKITTYNELDSYNEYLISDIAGNYSVNVVYKNNGEDMKQTFAITNFDNLSPEFEVSERIDLVSREENSNYSYIEVKNVVDDLSGIKYIKYEKENISDVAIYFKTNGIELHNEMIELDENTKYVTVFVEDNAGNFKSRLIDVKKGE